MSKPFLTIGGIYKCKEGGFIYKVGDSREGWLTYTVLMGSGHYLKGTVRTFKIGSNRHKWAIPLSGIRNHKLGTFYK